MTGRACRYCGAPFETLANFCPACGKPASVEWTASAGAAGSGARDDGADDVMSSIVPYKNPLALFAYYCGVFGLIPCMGALLGPAALILGIFGLRYRSSHPGAKGVGHAWAGIILGSLETILHALWFGMMFLAASA